MSPPPPGRAVRVGIDAGGTFTDVVAVDTSTGRTVSTKTPSTPADPSVAFLRALSKALDLLGAEPAALAAVSHGTTVATNRLLEGDLGRLGFVTTAGYRHVLEIARQSVPDGYGNSYFWVKPPRIVPAHLVRTVGGRLGADGSELRPLDVASAEEAAAFFRDAGVTSIGVCLLHAYADPRHERLVRDAIHRLHPGATVSLSSDVLREYREYERSVTTLVDAAVKPGLASYVSRISAGLDALTGARGVVGDEVPFYVMASNGGVLTAEEVTRQPVRTVLSGPAAGALGAALVAAQAGYQRVLTLDGGGTSTDACLVVDGEPALTTEGSVGGYPCLLPMLDVETVGAGGGSLVSVDDDGATAVGPRSAGADPGPMCYGRGGSEPTLTDAHLLLGRIPGRLLGGEVTLDATLAADGFRRLADRAGRSVEDTAAGAVEISAWHQANALRQLTVARGLDVRDFYLVAFGGSGPLVACRLLDLLGLAGVVVPPNPGSLSAYGLLTVDVRVDVVRTAVMRHSRRQAETQRRLLEELTAEAAAALARAGFAPADWRFERTADLRYLGQAYEVRVPVAAGDFDDEAAEEVVRAFHAEHRLRYGYDFRADDRQEVEWVNLRVTGVGPISAPAAPPVQPGRGAEAAATGSRPVYFGGWVEATTYDRARLGSGDVVEGPAVIEEFGSTVPLPPGYRAAVDGLGNLVLTGPGSREDDHAAESATAWGSEGSDVLTEVVAGYLAAVEREVETAIGRTARSPMIRDAHDYRAGIHDVRLRKLTGRSYSALVHPVVRDYPVETMRPGDVFFHNDVYLSEGGIGHLPDLCVTAPVFHDDGDGAGPQVVAFVQAFGHHDDIGGGVPGSMPSHATSVFEEGLMVPPIRLWDRGVRCEQALKIMVRNSRLPESLAADLDAECAACLMGAARLADLFARYGRRAVEASFDAIVAGTTAAFRREALARIPDGTYVWEDYAEHDGVDPPRLHRQRITLTKLPDDGGRLVLDFAGTSPQARGPINHAGNYADGNFLKKWLAPILRNLAESPAEMARLDVNEGVVPLLELRFPPPGTLLTPVFPAPTNARTFVILRLLGVFAGVLAKAVGGRMPADQETIRYTGVYGDDAEGRPYLMREVLGGGSGGRWYADGEDAVHVVPDSRNLPTEFSEARFPFVVEALGLAVDSGGAGRYRGGCGYEKHIRLLRPARFMSIADRSILSCWGVAGGRAGASFEVVVDPRGPRERLVDALADGEPVAAGEVIRIRTTGGGGWGDPLERPYDEVARDVAWGKVSLDGARRDYGTVLADHDEATGLPVVDVAASDALRRQARAERAARPDGTPAPFFDRGPGYARLSGGSPFPDVDLWPT